MCIEITDISDWLTTAARGFCGPVLVSREFDVRILRCALAPDVLVQEKPRGAGA